MKTTFLAIVALLAGLGAGLLATFAEFSADRLPTDALQIANPVSSSVVTTGIKSGIGPKVKFVGGEMFDFGTMDRYTSQTHDFVIRNDGDTKLSLIKGETTCKCTQFDLEREQLSAGQTAKITLKWEAKTTEPEFQQSAELTTNDPQRTKIRLVVAGHVVDAVRPERWELVVNTLSANEDVVARLKLFAYRSPTLQIEKAELRATYHAKFFDVSFEPLPPEGLAKERDATAGLTMVVKIKPGLPLGAITQTIRLTTNSTGTPPLDIPIVGKIVSDISLAGPKLDADLQLLTLGTVERDAGAKATIYVLVKGPHRDTTEIRVASTSPAANLKATLTPVGNDNSKLKRYSLTVEVPPDSPTVSHVVSGDLGKVILETTHPLVKQVVLNVRFAVKE